MGFFPHRLQSDLIVFPVLLANHTNNRCPDPFSTQTQLGKRLQEIKSNKFLHAGLFVSELSWSPILLTATSVIQDWDFQTCLRHNYCHKYQREYNLSKKKTEQEQEPRGEGDSF